MPESDYAQTNGGAAPHAHGQAWKCLPAAREPNEQEALLPGAGVLRRAPRAENARAHDAAAGLGLGHHERLTGRGERRGV